MSELLNNLASSLRRNVIGLLALFVALGAGGGYALAASGGATVHGCVSDRTHALYIQSRCHRGERPLSWAKQAVNQPALAWAAVQANGFIGAGARGISVDHPSTGTYEVTATPTECGTVADAPTVTVDTGSPPAGGSPAGAFPEAWESFTGRNTFTVYTGVVVGGSFTPTDEAFNVQVPCS